MAVTLLALGHFSDEPYTSFAGTGAVLLLLATSEVVVDHTDVALPPGGKRLAFGLVAFGVSAAWVAPVAFDPMPGVFLAFDAWAALDGVQRYRRVDRYSDAGGEWDDLDTGEATLRMQVIGTVGRASLEGPRTPEERAADLDVTGTRVNRALELMTDRGYAREVDGAYYADEDQFGGVAFVRHTLGGALRRLPRPF